MTKISPEKIKNFYENNISFDRDITRFLTMKGEIITNFDPLPIVLFLYRTHDCYGTTQISDQDDTIRNERWHLDYKDILLHLSEDCLTKRYDYAIVQNLFPRINSCNNVTEIHVLATGLKRKK